MPRPGGLADVAERLSDAVTRVRAGLDDPLSAWSMMSAVVAACVAHNVTMAPEVPALLEELRELCGV